MKHVCALALCLLSTAAWADPPAPAPQCQRLRKEQDKALAMLGARLGSSADARFLNELNTEVLLKLVWVILVS
jgi:hypothetical protein